MIYFADLHSPLATRINENTNDLIRQYLPKGTVFLLRFRPLFQSVRGCAFPCDAAGRVDSDYLSEAGRSDYLYARAMVGRELAAPDVAPADFMDRC